MKAPASADLGRERLVDRPCRGGVPFEADAAGQVGLRVHVDEQDALPGEGEGGREVDGGCGFPDAAFLIGDREDARWHYGVCPIILVLPAAQGYAARHFWST